MADYLNVNSWKYTSKCPVRSSKRFKRLFCRNRWFKKNPCRRNISAIWRQVGKAPGTIRVKRDKLSNLPTACIITVDRDNDWKPIRRSLSKALTYCRNSKASISTQNFNNDLISKLFTLIYAHLCELGVQKENYWVKDHFFGFIHVKNRTRIHFCGDEQNSYKKRKRYCTCIWEKSMKMLLTSRQYLLPFVYLSFFPEYFTHAACIYYIYIYVQM